MASVTLKVLILVKAAPVLTRELDETMCVAGIRLDTDPSSVYASTPCRSAT